MSDPRFTLPASPELLARAEAVARQRHEDSRAAVRMVLGFEGEAGVPTWQNCQPISRSCAIAAAAIEIGDLTRPASYDAGVRWLVELLAPMAERDGWAIWRGADVWELTRWTRVGPRDVDNGLMRIRVTAASNATNPREALVLALTAALEARR